MRIKILMLGDNPVNMVADSRLLKDKGFLVYHSFNADNLPSLVDELKPDIIFMNPYAPSQGLETAYNNLLTNPSLANTPIIYTLSEDDAYLVNRKRSTRSRKMKVVTDNIIDAVKTALEPTEQHKNYIPLALTIPYGSFTPA